MTIAILSWKFVTNKMLEYVMTDLMMKVKFSSLYRAIF
jgi:hypothetical protein